MKTKHYLKLGFSSHRAENITFLIDCNRDPWRLFCKRVMHSHFQTWEPILCDGVALKHHILETARPDTWQKETHPFRKKHQKVYGCDSSLIQAEWNFGKGIERRMCSLGVYDEGLLVGCREGRELVGFLKDLLPIDENETKK
jgi:hypothetical protein